MKLQSFRPESLLKGDLNTVFSGEYCEIFKNTYFEKHLGTGASDVNTEQTGENIFTYQLSNGNMFLSRVIFASNFLISGWISIKIGTNSQQARF